MTGLSTGVWLRAWIAGDAARLGYFICSVISAAVSDAFLRMLLSVDISFDSRSIAI